MSYRRVAATASATRWHFAELIRARVSMLRYYRQVPQKKKGKRRKEKRERRKEKGKRRKRNRKEKKEEREGKINGPRRQTFAFEFSRNIALDWTRRKKGETSRAILTREKLTRVDGQFRRVTPIFFRPRKQNPSPVGRGGGRGRGRGRGDVARRNRRPETPRNDEKKGEKEKKIERVT